MILYGLLQFFIFVCMHILQNANMPGMDLTGEIWVETKASEGKSYFYNARTRETTWTKPEGPAVKIITQEQVSTKVLNESVLHSDHSVCSMSINLRSLS
jgi:hypothetical protein